MMINSIFKSAQSARSRYWYSTLWYWQSSERRQNAKAHHSQNKQLNDMNLVVIKWHLLNNGHSTMSGNNDTGDHCWVKQSLAGVKGNFVLLNVTAYFPSVFAWCFYVFASGIHERYELGDGSVRSEALESKVCWNSRIRTQFVRGGVFEITIYLQYLLGLSLLLYN